MRWSIPSSGARRSSPRGEPLRPTSPRPTGGYNRPVRPREHEFDNFHSGFEELFKRVLRSFFS